MAKFVTSDNMGFGLTPNPTTKKYDVLSANVWRRQGDDAPATSDSEAIQHTGNVAVKQNLAVRSGGNMAASATLDATNKSLIRLTTHGNISGIVGGEDGKILTLMNASNDEIHLLNNNASAAAGTRISVVDGYAFVLPPKSNALLQYDAAESVWKVISQAVLGAAPDYLQAINSVAVPGLVTNSNIPVDTVAISAGTGVTKPNAINFVLKGGRTYRLRASIGIATIASGGWLAFRWHNGTAFVGSTGQLEQNATRPATGLAEAVVKLVSDTTYTLRVVSAQSATTLDANSITVWIEALDGLSPALPVTLRSRVIAGSQPNPNTPPAVPDPVQGDTYIQTDTGLDDGLIIAEWRYTGSAWRRVSFINHPAAAVPTTMLREYYPVRSAYVPYMTAVQTPAQIASHGFTAVGGATISNYGMYGGYNMFACNAARVTPANAFNIPTSYIRHELAITPGVDNTYFLSTLTDRANFVGLSVWVCNPTTGVPVLRVGSNSQSAKSLDSHPHLNIAPDNGHPQISSYYEFSSWAIPKAVVDSYKTASNTLRLAIVPFDNNPEGNLFYIGGWGMASNPYGLITQPVIVTHWQMEGTQPNALTWHGEINNIATAYVPASAVRRVRVPVLSVDKDVIFTVIGNSSTTVDSFFGDFALVHTSGNVQLGRLPVTGETPYGTATRSNLQIRKGFRIPASLLATKTTKPVNSGLWYLDFDIRNLSHSWANHYHGFAVEYA
ncbi:MAG: hypothetical protein ACK4RS_00190 [Thiothrix sp.]